MKLTPSTNTRLRKAVEIITDPDHPQHRLLVDLVDTAVELDPPASFVESYYNRPVHLEPELDQRHPRAARAHLAVVPPDGGAA